MQIPRHASDNNPAPVFPLDELRNFHQELPLVGDPPNALLSLPDDQLSYLIAAIRNTPRPPPDLAINDWHHLLALLRPHGVIPLIAFHLRTWPDEYRPPQEILEHLNRFFLLAAARSLRACRQIQTVTDALKDAGIPVILMKGHALARTVYPDPALRQSSDIDLLVQPHNIPGAEEVLENLGYTCSAKFFHTSQHEFYDECFSPPDSGLPIELHWTTDYGFGLVPEGWLADAFSRRIPIISGDLACDTFSPSDHLLYSALHNVCYHWSLRLDWMYDTFSLMAQIRTEHAWEDLGQQSVEHHVRKALELSLTAARLWTGCRLPGESGNFSTWPVSRERELRLLNYFPTLRTSLPSWVFLKLQGAPGLYGKLQFFWHFIFASPPMLTAYRRSAAPADIPLAHLRRWFSIVKYR